MICPEAFVMLEDENASLRKTIKQLTRIQSFLDEQNGIVEGRQQYEDVLANIKKSYNSRIEMMKKENLGLRQQNTRLQECLLEQENKQCRLMSVMRSQREDKQGLQNQIKQLGYKLCKVEQQYVRREQEIVSKCDQIVSMQVRKYQNALLDMKMKTENIEREMSITNIKCEKSIQQGRKIELLLESQTRKRKKREEEYENELEKYNIQIGLCKQEIYLLKELLMQKDSAINHKQTQIFSLQMTLRDLQIRFKNIQSSTQRELLKEKSKAKKALQGLQMMKKYSQHELSKSRKKQKDYKHSQKELMLKIKQIENKGQNEGMSTKSSRKTSIKSCRNTKYRESPRVSNFMVQEESLKLNMNDTVPVKISVDTPCFEGNQNKLLRIFRTKK